MGYDIIGYMEQQKDNMISRVEGKNGGMSGKEVLTLTAEGLLLLAFLSACGNGDVQGNSEIVDQPGDSANAGEID